MTRIRNQAPEVAANYRRRDIGLYEYRPDPLQQVDFISRRSSTAGSQPLSRLMLQIKAFDVSDYI